MRFILLTFVVSTSAFMSSPDAYNSASSYRPGMINMPRGNGRRDDYRSANGWEGGRTGTGGGSGIPLTDVEHGIIGGSAGVRKDSKTSTQYNVETGLIGGNAGIRHDNSLPFSNNMITSGDAGIIPQKRANGVTSGAVGQFDGVKNENIGTNPSGPSDWILNGGTNVKPWKSNEPDFNQLAGIKQNVKRDTGNMMIGGSAGVRKDNRDAKNTPSGKSNWVLNGGNDVKPWKTFEPTIRGIPRNN